jgi:hypothetical protein
MPDVKMNIWLLVAFGLVFVIGTVIRTLGISELVVRLKFRNDNTNRKKRKK